MHRFPVKFVLRQLVFFPCFLMLRHFLFYFFHVKNASNIIIPFQMIHTNCQSCQLGSIQIPELFICLFLLCSRFAVSIQNIFPDQCIFFLQIFPSVIFCFVFVMPANSFIGRLKDRKKLAAFVKWCLFKTEKVYFAVFADQPYTARASHSRRMFLLCKHNCFPEIFC